MSADNNPQTVVNDAVVSMAYKLVVDGEVLDEADDKDAIQFLQGHGNIISGLEKELAGMKVGDEKHVVVAPEDGYGVIDKDAVEEIAKSEFPEGVTPVVDMELEMKDQEGNEMFGRVVEIKGETVTMDFNHPLAGKQLHFDVKIVGVRAATGEEMSHGHVHAPGHHH
jgi:FKBP-type peptidyl-prolyl cis-trans isomerase SlyD